MDFLRRKLALLGIGAAGVAGVMRPKRALADTAFTNFSFAATRGSASRTMPDRLSDIVNVLDFAGVDPSGVADSTTGLQNALNAAANKGPHRSQGGATLFFPNGIYKVSSPLQFPAYQSAVNIMGTGKFNVTITGNVTGFILNCQSSGSSQFFNINSISDMSIINTNLASGNGCVLAGFIDNMLVIRNCIIQGFIGIDIGSSATLGGSFGSLVENCFFQSGMIANTADSSSGGTVAFTTGSVGAYIGQGAMINCRLVNYDVAIAISEQAGMILGCSVETSNTGIKVGLRRDGAWPLSAGMISAFQTERCLNGIIVASASGLVVQGNTITGQVAPMADAAISNAVWNGSTLVTVTTTNPHNLSAGAHQLYLQFNGYNSRNGFLLNGTRNTCTVTGASTFTYPLARNPGTFNAGAGNTWNYINIVGLQVQSATDCLFANNIFSIATTNGSVDLNNGGFASNLNCTMMNTQSGGGWIAPPVAQKTAWTFINCGDVTNVGNLTGPGTFAIHFADLPGKAGNAMVNAYEGMEFNIVDDNSAGTFGATSSGGGTRHAKVRYNGTTWTVMGI